MCVEHLLFTPWSTPLPVGHGGSETAELVSAVLPAALMAQSSPSAHAQIFQDVDAKIIKNFTNDHSLFHRRSDQWVDNAKVAKAGCTALIFDLDLKTMAANVANAGDCRLVVFHGDTQNPQQPVVSFETTDLNAKSVSEQARVKDKHPGEDMIFVSGRLFGRVMSTRGKCSVVGLQPD
jgi:pyruvate dehydrogenase phosphatase